ncbi:MAG: respiratory chain complex I subunit 1 family protein [Chloroflexota bacterium]
MINIALILLVAIFFAGIINRAKSLFSGRKGPGLLQPVKDIIRLLKKGAVYPETAGPIYRVAPSFYLTSIITAALFIPFAGDKGILSLPYDFVMFAYILGLGKFFNIIGALDAGSAFEGMGASREALFSMLAEPAFFIVMGSIGSLVGYSSFTNIFATVRNVASVSPALTYSFAGLAAVVFGLLALVENSRVPVDDPKTHLELTMIHEVMILDNSGFDLGLIHIAGLIKFAIYGALISNLFLDPAASIFVNAAIFIGIQTLFAVLIGTVESFMARFRINQNPQFIFSISSLALLVFIMAMILKGKLL